MPDSPAVGGYMEHEDFFIDGEFTCSFSPAEALSSFGRLRPVDNSERMHRRCARCDEPLLFDPQTVNPRPLLCHDCNQNLHEAAASYGGDYGEIYLRYQALIAAVLAGKKVV